jgi:hypothetical protein
MKTIVLLLVMSASFTTMAHGAAPSNDPGRGFNYKKHQRKSQRVVFFNRLFNRNGCYGKTNIN